MYFNKTIEERYKEYQEKVRNGIATVNDIRQVEGLDPMEGGDCKYINIGSVDEWK